MLRAQDLVICDVMGFSRITTVNTFCRVSKPQPCRLQGLRFQSLACCGRSSSTMQCNSISNSITVLMTTFHLFLSAFSDSESLYKNRPRSSAPHKELCGLTSCCALSPVIVECSCLNRSQMLWHGKNSSAKPSSATVPAFSPCWDSTAC